MCWMCRSRTKTDDSFNVKKNNVISMNSQSRGQHSSPFTGHPALRKPCLAYFKANICPYYHYLWCNETDKIILSHSLIRRHSLLVCCNSAPLFCSPSCLSSCPPLFHDCFAGHDDISLKMRRKRGIIRPVQLASSLCSYYYLPFSYYFLLLTHTHTATLSHLRNHNAAMHKMQHSSISEHQQL